MIAALILAGSRPGGDPMARDHGLTHKALIPIEGRPMLDHVAAALLSEPRIGRIAVSSPVPLPLPDPRMEMLASEATPALSVRAALRAIGTPLLVTTGDHPLLTPDWIAYFLDHLPDASAVAALARSPAVMSAAPSTKRTFLRLRGGAYSGCNLFFFRDGEAVRVVDVWRRVEAHRKHPWKMARMIGPGAILAYVTGRLTLEGALGRLGRRARTRLGVVDMPFGEAAIDVDKPEDLALVRRIMASRASG